MTQPFEGRREDERLLTGRGCYAADWSFPGQLHAHFLRAERAHAEIVSLRTSEAERARGVVKVFTGEDMAALKTPPPIMGGSIDLDAPGAKRPGFGFPLALWLRGRLRPLLRRAIEQSRLAEAGVFRADEMMRLAGATSPDARNAVEVELIEVVRVLHEHMEPSRRVGRRKP